METKTKKQMQAQYMEREITGGVYIIKNTENNKIFLASATDLGSKKNLFDFAQATGSCVDLKLRDDWNKESGKQFVFEVLEQLKKGEDQTMDEFEADIEILREIWAEKLSGSDFY